MRPCTVRRVTSTSRKTIWPASGVRSPLMRFTSVVLPAPFEPMSASTSRSRTVKFTWSTAYVSPKCLTRSCVTRRLTSARPQLRPHAPGGTHDAGGQRQHEHDQHHAQQELPVHRVPDGEGLEVVEDDRADDGSRERAKASEHGHEDDLARECPVHDVGRGEAVERHPQGTRHAGEDAGHHEGDPAVAPDPDADEL